MPDTGILRYIGKTSGTVKKRMREHLSRARHGARCGHIYTLLRSLDLKPEVVVLEEILGSKEDLDDAERFWIASIKAAGATLVNHTDGGEGGPGYKHTPETLAKMSASRKGKKPLHPPVPRRTTPEQDQEICNKYAAGQGCDDIGPSYSMTGGGIRKILMRCGVTLRNAGAGRWKSQRAKGAQLTKLDSDQGDEVVAIYVSGGSSVDIGKKFSVSDATIRNLLKSRGIPRRNSGQSRWLKTRAMKNVK